MPIGPAIAGLVIAALGVPPVFALNAACTLFLHRGAGQLAPHAGDAPRARERFLPALRAGGRYVRHEPVRPAHPRPAGDLRRAGHAMWALLPLIANRQLGLGAGGYGILFARSRVGAVSGGVLDGRGISRQLSGNRILILVGTAVRRGLRADHGRPGPAAGLPAARSCSAFAGRRRVATLNAELQLFLPGWVRARALAVYLMAFTGAQALASPIWG